MVGRSVAEGLGGFRAGGVTLLDEVLTFAGRIGKADEDTDEAGASCIVVDTGPWLFGREVLIPAGAVVRVDAKEKTVDVNLAKDSPECDKDEHRGDGAYRGGLRLPTTHGSRSPARARRDRRARAGSGPRSSCAALTACT